MFEEKESKTEETPSAASPNVLTAEIVEFFPEIKNHHGEKADDETLAPVSSEVAVVDEGDDCDGLGEVEEDAFDQHLEDHHCAQPYNPNSTAFARFKALNERINKRLYNEAKQQFETDEDLETGRPRVPLPTLPRVNVFWLLLVMMVHTFDTLSSISVVALVSWSGLSQRQYVDMYMFTDYKPGDLLLRSPEEFKLLTIDHVCGLVGCNAIDLNSTLWNFKNCSFTRTGKLLTTGIMGVDITFKNPRVWGWPALSTQREMFEKEAKNPLGELYSKATEGLLTPAVVSSLNITNGPRENFPPESSWLYVAAAFFGLTTVLNYIVVCCLDPEINVDPMTIATFEENKRDKIAEFLRLAKDCRARGMIADAKGHETTVAALRETKLPRMRCLPKMGRYACVLFKCEMIQWGRVSIRNGRESFLLLAFKLTTSVFQSFPIMTMIIFLGFSQPRRFSPLMILSVALSTASIALGVCLWEKNQLKSEKGETMRICSGAAFWMFGGRAIEVIVRSLTIGLFGATWGMIGLAVLMGIDFFVVQALVMVTWYQAKKSFNGMSTTACGAVQRASFIAPTLLFLYHDHYIGRVEQNTFVRPNLYFGWRALSTFILIPLILAKSPSEDDRAGDLNLSLTLGAIFFIGLNVVFYGWALPNMFKSVQHMRRLAKVGIAFPIPDRWKSSERAKLGKTQLKVFAGMSKSNANLLARYGSKLEELDNEAEQRNKGELDADDFDQPEEDEFAYKKRIMDMVALQEATASKKKQSVYVFEGVNVDEKLKHAALMMEEADIMIAEADDFLTEAQVNAKRYMESIRPSPFHENDDAAKEEHEEAPSEDSGIKQSLNKGFDF